MGQSIDTTFNNIAGFHMGVLHFAINVIAGGVIVLCAAIMVTTAFYQLNDKQEISLFTFIVVLFMTLAFTSIFLAFICT